MLGHEDHPPAGAEQPVQALAVLGHLLRCAVPRALVLQRQPVLGPREVHPRQEEPVRPDLVLGDGHRHAAPAEQQAQPRLLRRPGQAVREGEDAADVAAVAPGRRRRGCADVLQGRPRRDQEGVDRDDRVVERADRGQIQRRAHPTGHAGAPTADDVGIGEAPTAQAYAGHRAAAESRRQRDVDVVAGLRERDVPQHGGAAPARDRAGEEQPGGCDDAHGVREREGRARVDVREHPPPRRAAQLRAGEPAGPHRPRPPEQLSLQIGRSGRTRGHRRRLPRARVLARSSSTGGRRDARDGGVPIG